MSFHRVPFWAAPATEPSLRLAAFARRAWFALWVAHTETFPIGLIHCEGPRTNRAFDRLAVVAAFVVELRVLDMDPEVLPIGHYASILSLVKNPANPMQRASRTASWFPLRIAAWKARITLACLFSSRAMSTPVK